VCVRAFVRACMRVYAFARACVRVCVCVRVRVRVSSCANEERLAVRPFVRSADGDRNAELSNANESFADHRVTVDPPCSSPRRRAASTREKCPSGPKSTGACVSP
jgi:hypothetical protein